MKLKWYRYGDVKTKLMGGYHWISDGREMGVGHCSRFANGHLYWITTCFAEGNPPEDHHLISERVEPPAVGQPEVVNV